MTRGPRGGTSRKAQHAHAANIDRPSASMEAGPADTPNRPPLLLVWMTCRQRSRLCELCSDASTAPPAPETPAVLPPTAALARAWLSADSSVSVAGISAQFGPGRRRRDVQVGGARGHTHSPPPMTRPRPPTLVARTWPVVRAPVAMRSCKKWRRYLTVLPGARLSGPYVTSRRCDCAEAVSS